MTNKKHAGKTRPPVLVALLQETLNAESFDTMAELTEAVKCRAARLRIPYDSGRLTDAVRAVEHTRPVLVVQPRYREVQPAAEPGLSQADAVAILRRLGL